MTDQPELAVIADRLAREADAECERISAMIAQMEAARQEPVGMAELLEIMARFADEIRAFRASRDAIGEIEPT